jgi:hypothetical protein
MKKDEIRAEIVESIKIAQTQLGFTLVSEDWGGSRFSCSCALGCVLAAHGIPISPVDQPNIEELARVLDVDDNWIGSFMNGFDVSPPEEKVNKEAFLLGKEIHDEFKPVPAHLYMREWRKEQDRVASGD